MVKKTNKQSKSGEEITIPFHFLEASSYTNGIPAIALNMNQLETFSLGFAEMSDLYRYWRLNSITVKCVAWQESVAVNGRDFALLYNPNGVTAAASFSSLDGHFALGYTGSNFASNQCRPEPAVLHLTAKEVHTITPWFITLNDTSAGADADGPGTIDYIMRSTVEDGVLLFEVHMSITFRTRLDPAAISLAAERRLMKKLEYAALLDTTLKKKVSGQSSIVGLQPTGIAVRATKYNVDGRADVAAKPF